MTSRPGGLETSVRDKTTFDTHAEYLENITTGIDLSNDARLTSIVKSLSNQNMSLVVVSIDNSDLQEVYGKKKALLRCYNQKKKFFELAIKEVPLFVDIFGSTIAYILPSQHKENLFSVIDVGRIANEEKEIEATQGQSEPREIEHEFEETIIGFKLGYYLNPTEGNLKAVMWSETKAYCVPFNPDESKQDDYFGAAELEINGIYPDDILRIFDFGSRQKTEEQYDELPEFLLLVDKENKIHVMKGEAWGKSYNDYAVYDNDQYSEYFEQIQNIQALVLIQGYKIAGIIDKVKEDDPTKTVSTVVQIFEFNAQEHLDESRPFKMTKHIDLLESQHDFYKTFHDAIILDDYNNCFYVDDYTKKGQMYKFMLDNTISNKVEPILLTTQVAKNLVGNHTVYDIKVDDKQKSQGKTRGLLYQDFCCADNLLVLLHGKVVTCFDLQDKSKRPGHVKLGLNSDKDPYNIDQEPIKVWMMDKNEKQTDQRYKIIVAFKNGEVKELEYREKNNNESEIKLNDYLRLDRQFTKLPGQIIKVFRDRHSIQQPVYFLLKLHETGKVVFATIEFQSQTYRYYEIPGTNNNSTYIVLNIHDIAQQWQEVIAINTNIDKENNTMEQKLIHAKIRIGQYQLSDRKKEILILNKEDLHNDMENVKLCQDIFVSNRFIYFIHKKSADKYTIADNSHTKVNVNESLYKLLVFENQYFYWRTVLGGFNENRHMSKIYFDGLQNIQQFKQQCSETDVQIFSGIYPHINKLQYDSMSDSIACFVDFNQIKVFPLLHSPRIKVKVAGKRSSDIGILATQLISNSAIITLHADNTLKAWNLKTGKYMMLSKSLDTTYEGDFKDYQYHQRITDSLTLIRSKKPITDEYEEAAGKFHPKYDWSDEQNDIKMYKYKVIRIAYGDEDISPAKISRQTDSLNNINKDLFHVETKLAFVGPHDTQHVNFGLYIGNELDHFAFFWKDSQDKQSLKYASISQEKYEDDEEPNVDFVYLQKDKLADPANAKLSIHSPNFKCLIEDIGQKDYMIYRYDDVEERNQIPANLSFQTIDYPNFLTNDTLLFLTEDNIIKAYNYKTKEEEFMVTHCNFPGKVGEIDLATLLKVGSHVIGENCLSYEQLPKRINPSFNQRTNLNKPKCEELIAPNNFNPFFLEAAREHEAQDEYAEIKIIQCHYKSKIELADRGYYGYFYSQKELQIGVSAQLYVISTYSFYHWRMLSHLLDKKISIEDLNQDEIRNLSYVQLPNGDTLLHYIYTSKASLEYVYKTAQDPENEDAEPFHIPLLKNDENRTALDLAMQLEARPGQNLRRGRTVSSFVGMETKSGEKEATSQEAIYRKQTEEILKNIGLYPFGLFKVCIKKKLVQKMIESSVMEFGNFIDNCAKTPSFLRVFDRARVEVEETCGAKVFETNHIWTDTQDELQKKIQDEGADEKLITVKVLDLPFIHHYTNHKNNYIYESLSKTEDDSIFEKTAIKALIEQKWALAKSRIILYLLMPYLAFLGILMYYTLNNLEDLSIINTPQWDSILCRVFILLFVTYFSLIEVKQMYTDGIIDHIQDFWNYLDIVPPVLIIIAEVTTLARKDNPVSENDIAIDENIQATVRSLYAFTAIAMWLRFLYFFRIFRSTGYYIHMIVQVAIDMSQFFFIFGVVVVAFAHANYILSKAFMAEGSTEMTEPNFWNSLLIQYRNCIGDIQDGDITGDAMYSVLVGWAFLIICTLLVIIVLLNLLISIVGSTFGNVEDSKAQMTYKDLVQLIVENQFLISEASQSTLNQGKYLMIVVPEDQEELDQQRVEQGMKEIRTQMRSHHADLVKRQDESSYQIERLLKTLKKVQEQVETK